MSELLKGHAPPGHSQVMTVKKKNERGAARTLNQWLKRTPLETRFSHPMVYYTSLSPLDEFLTRPLDALKIQSTREHPMAFLYTCLFCYCTTDG